MRRGIAFFAAAAMVVGMTTPAFAAEQVTTFRGEQELTLTEAESVDLTKEELIKKAQTSMQDTGDLALIMKMDINASASYAQEGASFSMEMIMNGDFIDNRKGGLEYKSEKMDINVYGMDMSTESEEYIFENAAGRKVSVKKEISPDGTDEYNGKWVAEIVEEEDTEEPGEAAADIAEDLSEAAAEGDTEELGEDIEEESEEILNADSMMSDNFFDRLELLDHKYTDGSDTYYVLKGKTAELMGESIGELTSVFGEMNSDAECYMLLDENCLLSSMHMDLGALKAEEDGIITEFKNFMLSFYTEEPADIVIPEEVQAAGDAIGGTF